MLYLIGGLLLWWSAHFMKRLAPELRRDLAKTIGDKAARGLIALLILISVILMIMGYRGSDFVSVYTPYPGIGHLTLLLMFPALYLMGTGAAGGRLSTKIRHPMLWGLVVWSGAHLLVNGDLSSILLFGGLGLWALIQMRLINQHEGPWEVPMAGDPLMDYKLALTTLFLWVLIAGIHWLFDHNPFLGTYG